MKTFLIIVIIAVLGYFGWQQLQTQSDPATPAAIVGDTATDTPTDIGANPAAGGIQEQTVVVVNDLVTISFKGFGPGKEHTGSFGKVTSTLSYKDGAFSGSAVIDINSLTTDTEKVTEHLKTKDFFDTAKYPTATFTPTKWDMTNAAQGKFVMTGTLAMHGATKTVSFPVTFEEVVPAPNVRMAYTKSYRSTFTLNLKDFGISQAFANETVEVSVVVPVR
jgi:polyisoprenoid-binding protein YceI